MGPAAVAARAAVAKSNRRRVLNREPVSWSRCRRVMRNNRQSDET